jgi:hypothetical protein
MRPSSCMLRVPGGTGATAAEAAVERPRSPPGCRTRGRGSAVTSLGAGVADAEDDQVAGLGVAADPFHAIGVGGGAPALWPAAQAMASRTVEASPVTRRAARAPQELEEQEEQKGAEGGGGRPPLGPRRLRPTARPLGAAVLPAPRLRPSARPRRLVPPVRSEGGGEGDLDRRGAASTRAASSRVRPRAEP